METIKIPSIEEFPKLSGIYKFTNKTNGKIYIGETMNFRARMYSHSNRTKDMSWTAVVTRAFRKYGFSNFEYEIIESYPLGSVTKDFLIEREAFYIKELDTMNPDKGYNRCPYGANTMGYRFSDESKRKMSLAKIGAKHTAEQIRKRVEKIRGDNHWLRRNPVPKEIVDRFVQNNLTREITETERKNKSQSHINSENKPRTRLCQLDPQTMEIIEVWRSASDVIRFFNKHSTTDVLRAAKNTETKSAYGFKWRIATTNDIEGRELKTYYKEGFQNKRQTRYKRKLSRL